MPPTILCLSSYFKGVPFLQECKRQGAHVILVTVEELRNEAWPRESIDEFYMLPLKFLHQPDITNAVTYLLRERQVERIVPLDDYEVETAAELRDHLRMPGLKASDARFYRDKLAMRVQAQEKGVRVPEFVHVLNYQRLNDYMAHVPAPWVLKPRSEASAMGIKKIHHADELWPKLNELGDRQSYFLLEKFLPGDVYHVDSVVWRGAVHYAAASRYRKPPMTVYQGGGVFATSTLPAGSVEETGVQAINQQVIAAMGLQFGVTHAEFIHSYEDGQFYFLEMAARVGGAGIDQMLEYATGVNPWCEWAKLEIAQVSGEEYRPPQQRHDQAGLIVSLARQEWPDMSAYNDAEVVWRLHKKHHVGFILASPSYDRVQQLIDTYMERIAVDFTATAPPLEKPPH
jgi:biotin carboxylase